jgi:outer membrane protein TolC
MQNGMIQRLRRFRGRQSKIYGEYEEEKMIKFASYIGMVLLCVCAAAFNLQGEIIELNVDEAVALGLKNSTTLKTKIIAVNAARAAVQSSKGGYYPSVTLGSVYTHYFEEQKTDAVSVNGFDIPGQYIGSTDPLFFTLDINQTLYTFGQLRDSVRISEQNLGLAQIDLEEEKRGLIVDIKRVFYLYILSREVLEVQERTFEFRKEALDIAKKRFAAGLVPDYEVLSAETDVESFRPNLISAANQVEFALLAVKDLLNIKEEEGFDLKLIGELRVNDIELKENTLIELAMENQYALRQYKKNLRLMEISKHVTKNKKLPVISGFVQYKAQSGYDTATGRAKYVGEDSWDGDLAAGVSVQWRLSSLFPWSTEKADILKDSLDLEGMRLGMQSLESSVRLNVENILLQIKEEKAKIASRKKGVELASKLYGSARERYAKGRISSIELKESLISLNAAQLGYLESIYNCMGAQFDLMDAVGVDHF